MKKLMTMKAPAEQVVKDIRRATRKLHSFEARRVMHRCSRSSLKRIYGKLRLTKERINVTVIHTISHRGNGRGNYSAGRMQKAPR